MWETLKENMKEMSNHPVIAAMNFVGGVSGMLAMLTIVFFSGSIVEKIKSIDSRVTVLENNGSSFAREHAKEDNADKMAIVQRVVVLEEAVKRLTSIEGDVREINAHLKFLFPKDPGAIDPKRP